MPFAIYRPGPSDGALNLKRSLSATLLRTEGSTYRGRPGKYLINWGSSSSEALRLAQLTPPGYVLNSPAYVGYAANKLTCLQVLRNSQVATVPWYEDLQSALQHSAAGRIYARTKLTGSGGEGIHLIMSRTDPQASEAEEGLPYPVTWRDEDAPEALRRTRLFTVGITGKRQEWRIHVVRGRAILSQLKLRRSGFEDQEGYTSLVRNVESGWIYSVGFNPEEYAGLEATKALAVRAVEALGLDFGAVDIVERRGEPLVLEVNTAPGLGEEGSALAAYSTAFREIEAGRL